MAFGSKHDQYSEDIFSDTRMSFGEHIEDLRAHLLRAIYGFVIALILSFFIGKPVLHFIARPVEYALGRYWERYYREKSESVVQGLAEGDRELEAYNRPLDVDLWLRPEELRKAMPEARDTGGLAFDARRAFEKIMAEAGLADLVPVDNTPTAGWVKLQAKLGNPLPFFAKSKLYEPLVGRRPTLATLRVEEAFMVYLKVCIVTGFILASPWVFIQLWSFVAAGLYPQEKRYVNVFLPFSLALFLAGVAMCEFMVIPKAVEALLWFNEWLGLEPEPRLNDWLGFAILLPLVFGISFQTPLVMLFLERIGVMNVDLMRRSRRIAWFVMAIFAAVVTPTDAFSMIFLWVPMSLLYELGILLCMMQPPRPTMDSELSESDEMVEV